MDDSNTNSKNTALDKFKLYYEELPTAGKFFSSK